MVEVLVSVVSSVLATVGVTGGFTVFGTTIAYSTLAAWAIVATATYAVASATMRMGQKSRRAEYQVTSRQALPERQRTYGHDLVGGATLWEDNGAGPGAGSFYRAIYHGDGPYHAIVAYWLGDKKGPADMTAGSTLQPWGTNATVTGYLGDPDQAASAKLLSVWPQWTADHRGRGLVYSVLECKGVARKWISAIWGGGVPNLRIEVQGAICLTPAGSYEYSDNAGVCIHDYLRLASGFRLPAELVNAESFAAFADKCAAPRLLKVGGTEPRFRVSLTYKRTEAKREVLKKLLTACDGGLYQDDEGRVAIRGGEWIEPRFHIVEQDIISYRIQRGAGADASSNRMTVHFKDVANGFQPNETTPQRNAASLARVGLRGRAFDGTMMPSHAQASELARIYFLRTNPEFKINIEGRHSAFGAFGEASVWLTLPEANMAMMPFAVKSSATNFLTDVISLELWSYPPEIYDYNYMLHEGRRPAIAPPPAEAGVPPTPTGVALSLLRGAAIYLQGTVTPPATGTWTLIGQFRKVGETDWRAFVDDAVAGDFVLLSDIPLEDGATYEAQFAFAGPGGLYSSVIGSWGATHTITVVADESAPDVPPTRTAALDGADVAISWTAANSANHAGVRIYRRASGASGDPQLRATVYGSPSSTGTWVDPAPAAGEWFYWLAAINASGVASAQAATAPASVTVT